MRRISRNRAQETSEEEAGEEEVGGEEGGSDVPAELDEEVAKLALMSKGINLQKPTPQQIDYAKHWEEGT